MSIQVPEEASQERFGHLSSPHLCPQVWLPSSRDLRDANVLACLFMPIEALAARKGLPSGNSSGDPKMFLQTLAGQLMRPSWSAKALDAVVDLAWDYCRLRARE